MHKAFSDQGEIWTFLEFKFWPNSLIRKKLRVFIIMATLTFEVNSMDYILLVKATELLSSLLGHGLCFVLDAIMVLNIFSLEIELILTKDMLILLLTAT